MRLRFFLCVLLVLALAVPFALGVDKKKFKTCEQASFCKRNRARDAAPARYSVAGSSVAVFPAHTQAQVQFHLRDTAWPLRTPLLASVTILDSGAARFHVTESQPVHPRWEVPDVTQADALKPRAADGLQLLVTHADGSTSSSAQGVSDSDTAVSASFKAATGVDVVVRLSLAPQPFKLVVLIGGEEALRLNSRGLLHFEPYRAGKNPRPDGDAAAQADPSTQMHPYDEDGMWDEKYQSHDDSKPRGPADLAMDMTFSGSKHLYGLAEHASSLKLKKTAGKSAEYGEPFRLYNLDVFEFDLDEPMALYGAIPFILSHDARKSVGVLWLNSAETFVDISEAGDEADGKAGDEAAPAGSQQAFFMSESGVIDVYILPGPRPLQVSQQYADLTGHAPMPQRFAISYHQCRWNYKSEDDVAKVNAGFDEHDIPYDVLWLDIEHTDGKKYFTWDKTLFPTPADMQNKLAAKGRHMVTIVDPHIKRDNNYHVHKDAANKFYVKKPKNKGDGDFEGWCWPGSVSYLDFLRPEVREYWAQQFAFDRYVGSTEHLFTWNDMNEPSVFNGPEVTMHKDCVHRGQPSNGDELIEVEHRDVHNVYGMYVHRSTFEGQLARQANTRPFVLTRAFFAGSQRYGAVWTGDNMAKWDHLESAQPMLLSLAVSGFSFSGADVGGFFGNPDVELLTRWYQVGAFQPFFRAHAHIEAKRREPWLFGEPHTSRIRAAIRQRYAFLPFFYTVFQQMTTTGAPVIRPTFYEFPDDPNTFGLENQFIVGNALLVHPVVKAGVKQTTVYFPGTEAWYDVATYAQLAPGPREAVVKAPIDKIPVFQRAGTIVPKRERARRSSTQMVRDPYTLVVAVDSSGKAEGFLYVDDGSSFDFRNGAYVHRRFTFDANTLRSEDASGGASNNALFSSGCTVERIVLLGVQGRGFQSATLSVAGGDSAEVEIETHKAHVQIRKPDAPIDQDWAIVLA